MSLRLRSRDRCSRCSGWRDFSVQLEVLVSCSLIQQLGVINTQTGIPLFDYNTGLTMYE